MNAIVNLAGKLDGQTTRIVLDLDRSGVSVDELKRLLADDPPENLQEVIVVKGGEVTMIFPPEEKEVAL